jgi:hypothetical protein
MGIVHHLLWLESLSEGADNRVRTDDLVITNHLLYRLSYVGILLSWTQRLATLSVLKPASNSLSRGVAPFTNELLYSFKASAGLYGIRPETSVFALGAKGAN